MSTQQSSPQVQSSNAVITQPSANPVSTIPNAQPANPISSELALLVAFGIVMTIFASTIKQK